MKLSRMACCYYPTTVVIIDDNRSFLENTLLDLDENIRAISFTEPTKAINYLNSHVLPSFAHKYIKPLKDSSESDNISLNLNNTEHEYIDIDLPKIQQEIYNSNRFNTAIVVVVDYTMPEMNGIELCKSLKELPLKFVLITGDATLNDAIEAFNNGLIHQFIPKSSNDFTDKLQDTIHNLQETQFEESSDIVIKGLSVTTSSSLTDQSLILFIKDFFKTHKITEYYLVNCSGCFLTLKANGDLGWLVIKSENEMIEYEEAARDNYAKEKVIEELHSRKKLLFLKTENEHINVKVEAWENYLYPATKIIGDCGNNYYYAYVDNKDIPANKILSYEKYLREQD